MHYLNLITLEIPEVEQEPEIDTQIQEEIKLLQMTKSEKDFMTEYWLEKLKSCSNAFGRMVDVEIDKKLDPYYEQTDNPDYLEFEDHTEELQNEYEIGKIDCIRLPGGKIYSIEHPIIHNRFFIGEDGLVYQKDFGKLHRPKRSKRAKKMIAYKNYPYKKIYKTFDEFARKERYFSYNDFYKGYGYVWNPKAFYDWYQIGGRWPFIFLVKDDCQEFSIGEKSWGIHTEPNAPKGYKWVCVARKKDIVWNVMFKCAKERATNNFYCLKKGYEEGKIPEGWYGKITETGIAGFGEALYIKGETVQQYLARHRIIRKYKYPVFAYGYLDEDGEYRSEDDIVLTKDKNKRRRKWHKQLKHFIDSLCDDTVLVGVDCHI